MTVVMIVGLIMLAVGAIDLAVAVWRSRSLPRWAGIALAIGLSLWLPLLPRPIRVLDGMLIGLGGVWLAWGILRKGAALSADDPHRGDAAMVPREARVGQARP
jgi:uncharacterized membrane protein HdeD (DUF308 family)